MESMEHRDQRVHQDHQGLQVLWDKPDCLEDQDLRDR